MANELKISKSITYENGSLKHTYQPGTIQVPQAAKGISVQTINATTAEADVSVATLGTPGLCVLQNLEATTTGKTWNYGIKSSTGGLPKYNKLPPKHLASFYYGTSDMVLRGKAASGTVYVQIITYEA